VTAGLAAAKIERMRQGARGKTKLLSFLSFGSFNKGFEGRTPFDWLSRDPDAVDRYVDDPRCGFECTDQLWIDLLEALLDNGRPERLTMPLRSHNSYRRVRHPAIHVPCLSA
jgi:alpha-beta hydrolase superfamily lysophospholipase